MNTGQYSLFEPSQGSYIGMANDWIKYYVQAHYLLVAFIVVFLLIVVIFMFVQKKKMPKGESMRGGGFSSVGREFAGNSQDISAYEGAEDRPVVSLPKKDDTLIIVKQPEDACGDSANYGEEQAYAYQLGDPSMTDAKYGEVQHFDNRKMVNLKVGYEGYSDKKHTLTEDDLILISQGHGAPTTVKY